MYVLFEKSGTEISELKIVFQKNCPQNIYTIILPIKLNLWLCFIMYVGLGCSELFPRTF